MDKKLAPVVIFVYNRLDNTKAVVEALQKNYLAKDTDVFIYSDAAKNKKNEKKVYKVRQYIKTINEFKSVTIIERKENFYIEKNIIEGVTEIINKYGKVIVLEDDGVTAKYFLSFMNNALNFYENIEQVMHIASFTFIKMPGDYSKTIIWRYPENTGGGWATWKNRWDKFIWFKTEQEALNVLSDEQKEKIELEGSFKCLRNLKLNPIPWDICWYINIIRNNGLTVNSPKSFVKNNGLSNGTHFSFFNRFLGKHPLDVELSNDENIIFEDRIIENDEAIKLLKKLYSKIENKNKILKSIVKTLFMRKI